MAPERIGRTSKVTTETSLETKVQGSTQASEGVKVQGSAKANGGVKEQSSVEEQAQSANNANSKKKAPGKSSTKAKTASKRKRRKLTKAEMAKRVQNILTYLEAEYPDATCSLNFTNPFELLIATILSAQCTDKRVNEVTKELFKKYPDPESFATADLAELEEIIRPTGFFRNKARNIINCAQALVAEHGCEVPRTLEELTPLAGVGRKTANVVLGDAFGVPGIVIDTHAKRLSQRLGLTREENPEKIEFDLMKIIPEEKWTKFCHQLIDHGRAVCTARSPKCEICQLKEHCDFGQS